jgi:hypothetical protein
VYLPYSEIEKDFLRQGDIIKDVHILGTLNLNCIQVIHPLGKDLESWLYNEKPVYAPAMIISHSCEIDKTNGVKLTSIILAPIRDIDKATQKEKKEELIASNVITEGSKSSYLKYFYLEPSEMLPFHNGGVVDFSKPFSLNKKVYDLLLANKILQLTGETVESMSFKLSLYYYRTNAA